MKRFRTITLGCRVNQYETAFVRASLLNAGWEETARGDEDSADLVLINTCSVTAESDAKCRKMISGASLESPHAEIIVMGCYAASDPKKVASYQNVSEVLTDKRLLPGFLTRRRLPIPDGIDSFGERHRAYIKIQDGCRVGCSYCIIPKVRPYLASRPEEEILCEIRRLAELGYREIVLSGIHLGHYGLDLISAEKRGNTGNLADLLEQRKKAPAGGRHTLASLLRRLVEQVPGPRFRLGSLEAVEVSDDLVSAAASFPDRICPHFHLSMQSGDDAVLARMKRRWPSGPFIERSLSLREQIPDAALTTDIIVGFPGETDAEFQRTCEVAEKIRFSKIHIFRYSRRPGTEAAQMKDQVPEPVKKERAKILGKIAARLRAEYAESLIGKKVAVLVEDQDEEGMRGTSEYFLPVRFAAAERVKLGEMRELYVEAAEGELLCGRLC